VLAERSRRYIPSQPSRVDRRGPDLEQARIAPRDRPSARVTRTLRAPLRNPALTPPAGRKPDPRRPESNTPKRRAPPKPLAAPSKKPQHEPKKRPKKQRTPVLPQRAPAKPQRKRR
jgi:hypothetical protein